MPLYFFSKTRRNKTISQHSNARVKIQLLFLFCATRRQKTLSVKHLFHFSLLRRLKASIKVYDEQEEHVFVDSGTNSNVV